MTPNELLLRLATRETLIAHDGRHLRLYPTSALLTDLLAQLSPKRSALNRQIPSQPKRILKHLTLAELRVLQLLSTSAATPIQSGDVPSRRLPSPSTHRGL